ncbi:hypothetical protein CMV16_13990 [Peribacillus simplex]|nr:hypothetical protein CMV16_13990 [Peribacillus simplex]
MFKFALEEYEASYSTGDFSGTQVSEARILYLAGEISRKIGNEKAAIKYFKKMPGKPPLSRWPGTLSGTQTDPGNNPPFAEALIKKRAVPSRNSLLSAVDD